MYIVMNTNNNRIIFPHVLDSGVIDTSPFYIQEDADTFAETANKTARDIGIDSDPFVVVPLGE